MTDFFLLKILKIHLANYISYVRILKVTILNNKIKHFGRYFL